MRERLGEKCALGPVQPYLTNPLTSTHTQFFGHVRERERGTMRALVKSKTLGPMAPLQTTKNGETFRWTLSCRWVERRVERTQNSLQPQAYIFSFLSFCHPLLLNFFAALVQNPYFTLPLPPRLWWDVPFRHLRVYSVRNHEKSIWGDPGLTTNYKYPQMGMNALKKERGIQMLNNEDTHHTEQSSYYKHGSLSTREERYERKKWHRA